MKSLFVAGGAAVAYFGLLFRISAFRRDRPLEEKLTRRLPRYLGMPYDSLAQVFRRDNYTPHGQRLLPWLSCAACLLVLTLLAVLVQAAQLVEVKVIPVAG